MLVFDYLKFWFTSGNAHGLHSPFVFDLYNRVISNNDQYYCFNKIEHSRQTHLASDQKITVSDLGAGSKKNNSKEKYIREIAAVSLKNPRLGQLLFKLVNEFKPKIIFDLGTSLGTTTMYLASADSKSQVYTFEGCENIAREANENFTTHHLTNIKLIIGNIDNTLPETLKKVNTLDFVFFDANHKLAPTLNYFELCLQKSNSNSVFIFDDIYWSDQMKKAWSEIKNHPSVTLTIDLFHIGLVFFRKEPFEKQHFKLRY